MSDLSDEKLESLLSQAGAREIPDATAEARARAAVHRAWKDATRNADTPRRWRALAAAAALMLAAFVGMILLRPVPVESVTVASIQMSSGTIHWLSQPSVSRSIDDLTQIHPGQRVVTGHDGRMALVWNNGGSLRVDSNSEIEFIDASTVHLHKGRLYFDSTPAALLAGPMPRSDEALNVTTRFGNATHVGTQFIADVDADELSIAVREGRVAVKSGFADTIVENGRLGEFYERRQPVILSIKPYGERWQWVAESSPPIDADGRPINEFLEWASRELGYRLEYETDAVKHSALTQTLAGTIVRPPEEALTLYLMTTGFEWHVDEGVLRVNSGE